MRLNPSSSYLQHKRRKAYQKGLKSEKIACWFLRLKGYHLLAHRLKTPFGEIDLLMWRGDTLIVVEVKARSTVEAGLEALSHRAQKRLTKALQFALTRQPQYGCYNIRFDIIVVRPWRLPLHLCHMIG